MNVGYPKKIFIVHTFLWKNVFLIDPNIPSKYKVLPLRLLRIYKAHIPLKTRLCWVPNANEINTKKHEMYTANARNLRLGPNATCILLTCVWRRGFSHSNTKLWRWGSKLTPGPNANGFASQWNIGLKYNK